jgi:hypothetical protein
MATQNCYFHLQNRLIQTSQTGGQWYSDTSPFNIPCYVIFNIVSLDLLRNFKVVKIICLFLTKYCLNKNISGPGKPMYFFGQFPLVSTAETALFGKLPDLT